MPKNPNNKRQNLTQTNQEQPQPQPLLPGLPDDIAQLCLSDVQPSILYKVCRSWRRLIYSSSFPPFLSLYTLLSSKSSDHNHNVSHTIHLFTFDPISSTWQPLPSPKSEPPVLELLLLHHPSFLSRKLPIQSVSVSDKLIILAATGHNFYPALTHPLVFNPILRNWILGPPLLTPRRWCASGSFRNAVYVASGIGSRFSPDVARSMEKWDVHKNDHITTATTTVNHCHNGWRWEKMKGLKDGRFSREAIDAVGWRGKLCMVNVKGDAPKDGVLYDIDNDTWEEMSEGMIKGWRGPVAAMDEEEMYMVDETDGSLRKYDQEKDDWKEIIKSDVLVGAQQIAAARGKVCVVRDGDGEGIVVMDVVAAPPRMWVVDAPTGFQVLRVHILPRMSQTVTGS